MGVTQEGQKCIFMLCMEVAEEDMEVQEETVQTEFPISVVSLVSQKAVSSCTPTFFFLHPTM